MKAENGEGSRIVESAFFDHQLRAAFFACGRTFFSGLKQEFD
jgi:hypothetical protein